MNEGAKRPIRVLLIAPSLAIVGGQSVQANYLLEYFRDTAEIEVRFLPFNLRLPRIVESVRFLRTVARWVMYCPVVMWRVAGADLVHVFSASFYSYNLWSLPALAGSKLWRKRIILNYHDGQAEQHLAHWRSAVPTLRRMDRIVTPSAYLVEVFRKYNLPAALIYNVIDSSRFRFRPRVRPAPVFLHNRMLEPLYNVECTLRAFQLIQKRYPEARLTVAHDGVLRRSLEKLAAELGLKNTRFIGRVAPDKIPDLYDGADIYLTSPNIDCMPLSLLECFASGLPVVATRVGGIPFIVEHERTGLLVEANDHGAMAESAFRLMEEEGLAERLGRSAVGECEKYRWDVVGEAWVRLYQELAVGAEGSGS
jgi:glycosyltransferase involved in cell wall biosynthesis